MDPGHKRIQLKGCIVAIDGPSGAGKSTVSRLLAEALEGRLLDTGAMYRAVGYFSLKAKAATARDYGAIARRLKFDIDLKSGAILVAGEDLGAKLRSPKVSQMASKVSQFKSVRNHLTRQQRALAKKLSKKTPVVVEGRDIGTIVFPDVRFKFYVTADAEVRAQRRYRELKRRGVRGISLKYILKQIDERDRRDSGRKLAPLKCPEDAVVVDTSHMAVPQVVHFMANHITGMSKR